MDLSFWCLVLWVISTVANGQNCKKEAKCRISRVHGMKGADCYKKEIRVFPQCLTKDIEIIDLSLNRIRKLSKSDLERYSDLKMLYLSDNVIINIDNETFESTTELTTLDLSINAISKLPPVVFHLPSLKSLYLGQNMNMNVADSIQKSKPITSPLVQLDISYIMTEEPDELPDLGEMPFLKKYNISGNKITAISPTHFAGLCNLELLDTTNVTIDYEKSCDCLLVNQWLRQRKVKFTTFDCGMNEKECSAQVIEPKILDTYTRCKEKIEQMIKKSKIIRIVVPIVVILILMLCALAYFIFTWRRRRIMKARNKSPPIPEGQMLI